MPRCAARCAVVEIADGRSNALVAAGCVICGAVAGFPADKEIEDRFLRLEASLEKLPPIREPKFVIPGDSLEDAAIHCARSKCRTAETLICALRGQGAVKKYINRLSLVLFRICV